MRQWLRLRDARCSFPACNNPSLDNDADHLLAWSQGGTTGISNLGQACPRHHRLKHSSPWRPVGANHDRPPGWISPTGRYYPSEQQDWEPPHWPENLEPANLGPDNLEGSDSLEPDNPDWGDGIEPDSKEWPGSFEGLDPPPPVDPPPAEPLPVDPFPDWLDSLEVLDPPPLGEPLPMDSLPADPFPEWAQFPAA